MSKKNRANNVVAVVIALIACTALIIASFSYRTAKDNKQILEHHIQKVHEDGSSKVYNELGTEPVPEL